MSSKATVLILDDDPSHLEIYGALVRTGGFEPLLVPVRFSGPDPIPNCHIDVVLLDYRLNSLKTAPEIALELRTKFPAAPIILLSDLWWPPADAVPYITDFVRKGEPEKLLQMLRSFPIGSQTG